MGKYWCQLLLDTYQSLSWPFGLARIVDRGERELIGAQKLASTMSGAICEIVGCELGDAFIFWFGSHTRTSIDQSLRAIHLFSHPPRPSSSCEALHTPFSLLASQLLHRRNAGMRRLVLILAVIETTNVALCTPPTAMDLSLRRLYYFQPPSITLYRNFDTLAIACRIGRYPLHR